MANDRFVYVEGLDHDTLERTLVAYVGGAAAVEWNENQGRWYVTLPSAYSDPFRRIDPEDPQERWIEVYDGLHSGPDDTDEMGGPHIDVITRHADSLVNAIAGGFANLVSHRWSKNKRACYACGRDRVDT